MKKKLIRSKMKIKILSIFLIIAMVSSLVLFVLGKINPLVFWGIAIIIALIAYKGIPWLQKRVKAT